jgi:hypothetical protein
MKKIKLCNKDLLILDNYSKIISFLNKKKEFKFKYAKNKRFPL